MSVKLIYSSPIWLIANGIRQSHDNHHLSDSYMINGKEKASCVKCGSVGLWNIMFGELECLECGHKVKIENHIGYKDYDLIKRVGFKHKHESVLEPSLIVFEIEASRALLQELSRHRIGISPTVKSTRYTLKELINVDNSDEELSEFLYLTENKAIDNFNIQQLRAIQKALKNSYVKSNDIAKYAIPEAFKFKGQYSMNLRALLNLLRLRLSKDALHEFQQLCADIIDKLPNKYIELVLLNEKIKSNYERIKN
ncbi:MAG: hypothetical protein GXO49_06370, partial [Chlorobi bacterium]|nr:hypothetical protein [Chlorobiota bacterium]